MITFVIQVALFAQREIILQTMMLTLSTALTLYCDVQFASNLHVVTASLLNRRCLCQCVPHRKHNFETERQDLNTTLYFDQARI